MGIFKGRRLAIHLLSTAVLLIAVSWSWFASAQSVTRVEGKTGGWITLIRADPADAAIFQQDASNAERPWVEIPGTATTFTTHSHSAVLVTFTAQHRCSGSPAPASGWGCYLRAVVDGIPLVPSQNIVGVGFGNLVPQEIEGATSSQFSIDALPRGRHTLSLQFHTEVARNDIQVGFLIRTYHLTVEQIRSSWEP